MSRYREFARQFRIPAAAVISEIEAGTPTHVVLYRVIAAAEAGDAACVELLVEFIQEDRGMKFGRIYKSSAARALRRAALNYGQEDRIRRRVVKMLIAGTLGREFKEYAKLLRRVGLGEWLPVIEREAPVENPWVARYVRYFRLHAK